MKKEVLLALKGLQFAATEEDARALETITPAEYYKRNDSHYIIYDEVMEDFSETVKNTIKIKGSQVEVTKKGFINVHMIFEQNKRNMTRYGTPYGDILIGIDTGDIRIIEDEDSIHVDVDYSLEANYEHMADCKLEMNISPREEMLEL